MSRPTLTVPRPAGGYTPHAKKKIAVVSVIAAIVVFFVVDPQWVVVSIKPPGTGSIVPNSATLNPDKYVAAYWATKIIPTVKRSAVDLPVLLADLKQNRAGTSKRYGNFATLGGPPTFLVKGSGRVVSVNTSSIPSEAGVALGAGATADAFLQLGPIITGTDVRDALPFIKFGQFVNQVSFGEVATAINAKIVATALAKVDDAKLKGKQVTFTGAFTLASGKPLITPITLGVGP
jgi:predicted lipoprotein